MQNLPDIAAAAKAAGITVKQFCSYCPNAATGELVMVDGEGNRVPVPVCESCLGLIRDKFKRKFDK